MVSSFHRPQAERYRRGRDSPEGYYRDSFDLRTLRRTLLDPLGTAGSRRVRLAAFDHRTDRAVHPMPVPVPAGSVLIFDGVFLQTTALAGAFDRRYREGQRLYLTERDPANRADLVVTSLSGPSERENPSESADSTHLAREIR